MAHKKGTYGKPSAPKPPRKMKPTPNKRGR